VFSAEPPYLTMNASGFLIHHHHHHHHHLLLLLLLQVLQLHSLKVLALSTYNFRLLRSWMQLVQFFIFIFFISFIISSFHLLFGLSNGRVNIGFHLYTIFTILSSGIRRKWPNQLNVCAFMWFTIFLCLIIYIYIHIYIYIYIYIYRV